MEVDPIGFAGGDVNLYGYVQNNPVNFTDPYGLNRFLINQFFNRTTRTASNFYLNNIDPSGRRIISTAIGGGVGGAVTGAIFGSPALGIGSIPSAIGGGIAGFSGGLLYQTLLEAMGFGQVLENLRNQLIEDFMNSFEDDPTTQYQEPPFNNYHCP